MGKMYLMKYLFIEWQHDFNDEPIKFYMELDDKREQLRVIEIYRDGNVAFATIEGEYNTFLAKEAYPTIEEINSNNEFNAVEITKEVFEFEWSKIKSKFGALERF